MEAVSKEELMFLLVSKLLIMKQVKLRESLSSSRAPAGSNGDERELERWQADMSASLATLIAL